MTDRFITLILIAGVLVLGAGLALWLKRRRAAFHSALAQRNWQLSRSGEKTVVVPGTGAWTLTMTRSYAAQMSPPSTHIVASTWEAPNPRTPGPVMVVGPAPAAELRDLTVTLLGSATPAMTHWLGIDRVSGARPLAPVPGVDGRVLALATDDYRPNGKLADVAEAIGTWCSVYGAEREQPAVTIDDTGICVRVRVDVLRSLDVVDAFVELGLRCQGALRGSVA